MFFHGCKSTTQVLISVSSDEYYGRLTITVFFPDFYNSYLRVIVIVNINKSSWHSWLTNVTKTVQGGQFPILSSINENSGLANIKFGATKNHILLLLAHDCLRQKKARKLHLKVYFSECYFSIF